MRLSAHGTAFISFLVIFAYSYFHLKSKAFRDPGSLFFDPERAFEPLYTKVRQDQANRYIEDVDPALEPREPPVDPDFFVGIVTTQRIGGGYFKTAVGSLLEGLHDGERDNMHLTFFVANTDPTVHDAYHQPWFHSLPDSILTYKDAPADELKRMKHLEANDPRHKVKPLHDYIKLLQHGYDTRAPYVIVLEDDVLAMDSWLHRSAVIMDRMWSQHFEKSSLYVRLFYNSRLHGWNSENWQGYLMSSIALTVTLGFAMIQLRRCHPPLARFFTYPTIFVILFICTPACIGLYFAAGRLTVAPLRQGLERMEKYGCCSQAFAFPRQQIPGLIEYYEAAGEGYADQLTEKYADETRLRRWALVPSIFQHVGGNSSKGDKSQEFTRWHRTQAQNIWNVDFELNDADRLRDRNSWILD